MNTDNNFWDEANFWPVWITKAVILVIFFFVMKCCVMNAQVFVTLEPAYLRPGVLLHQPLRFTGAGLYAKAWYGDIKMKDPTNKFYTENIKIGAGMSYLISTEERIFVGLNRNFFFNTHDDCDLLNLDLVHKYSFDVGVSKYITDNFTILFMTDFLNWESCIGFTFKFR